MRALLFFILEKPYEQGMDAILMTAGHDVFVTLSDYKVQRFSRPPNPKF
jgi:hypothetical protein